ncbi:MAG: hypothetical protein JSV05_00305 [Candidatus Bathyarchaeota archaeon]|nr:MAG: hypothetical protein JSV05_00305 [Candidatus Bathyarchaeota archaeon]
MPGKDVRGILAVLLDLLKFLRIYKQRDFWIQVAAGLAGVFLWMIVLPSEDIAGAVAAAPILIVLTFIMINIIWAGSQRPYACVLGSLIGYGLYNLAVSVIVHHLSITEILVAVIFGVIYAFVFSSFAFMIFNFLGLIKMKQEKGSKTIGKIKKGDGEG